MSGRHSCFLHFFSITLRAWKLFRLRALFRIPLLFSTKSFHIKKASRKKTGSLYKSPYFSGLKSRTIFLHKRVVHQPGFDLKHHS